MQFLKTNDRIVQALENAIKEHKEYISDLRSQNEALQEANSKYREDLDREYKHKKEMFIAEHNLQKQKEIQELEAKKDKEIMEIERKLRKEQNEFLDKALKDNYDRLKSSLNQMHEEGTVTTKFLQDVTVNMLKGHKSSLGKLEDNSQENEE